jgi:hypothetical protein
MYVISYIKQGFGNKIFLLQNVIYFYLELKKVNPEFNKLYISILKSKHEKESTLSANEEFLNIFPNLTTSNINIEFIKFKEFDTLKLDSIEIDQNELTKGSFKSLDKIKENIYFKTEYNFSLVPVNSYYKLFKKLFKVNEQLSSDLLYDYDYKNDIMVHIRYGDKLNFSKKVKNKHIVLRPKYYFDAIYDLIDRLKDVENKRVFVFTDDIKEIKTMFMEEFSRIKNTEFIISDEPYWNVYHLCTQFENLIVSNSTLTYAGIAFNETYKNVIAFAYEAYWTVKGNKNRFWPNKPPKTIAYKKELYFINELNKKDFLMYKDFDYLF